MRSFFLLCFILLTSTVHSESLHTSHSNQSTPLPGIVLIIDDLGYRNTDFRALNLPGEVTFSILPHTPNAQFLAQQAKQQKRDVMLHLPMEANSSKRLGPGALTANMYPKHVMQTLVRALESVPNAVGVNNHMGSLLTRQVEPMHALMTAIKSHDLFFIDSRTTSQTVAERVAQRTGVKSSHRHVFIDHEQTEAFMQQQFAQLIKLAKRNGKAIGIAHPHPSTFAFLEKALSELHENNVSLVSVSSYFGSETNVNSDNIAPQPVETIAPNE